MTADEVLAILDAADFDQLVGEAEGEDLEFKGQPYRFDDDRQAFEYAKDISALANGRGGLLLIGFVTERTPGSATDTVSAVRPFDRALFDEAQCVDKVRQLVYPLIVGVTATFKLAEGEADRGVAVVQVPEQHDEDKYFLVRKEFIGPEGAPGWLIGISVRSFDRDRPLAVAEVHALVSAGRNVTGRLDQLQAVIDQIDERTRAQADALIAGPDDAVIRDRVDAGFGELEAENE
jgi:hypothetical protein